jgi:hypothetical protein
VTAINLNDLTIQSGEWTRGETSGVTGSKVCTGEPKIQAAIAHGNRGACHKALQECSQCSLRWICQTITLSDAILAFELTGKPNII